MNSLDPRDPINLDEIPDRNRRETIRPVSGLDTHELHILPQKGGFSVCIVVA